MVNWVQEVKRHSYEVILATLLPHPPDFAKVGGQWERLSSRTDQVKEGLQKLIMLGPYDIVSFEVWDYIMPYWIESIRTELSLKERETIKSLLKRTFDMDMSPLPFLADKIYHFLFARFESVDPYIQEQGLQWLQILTSVDVAVPFITILKAFMRLQQEMKSHDMTVTERYGDTNQQHGTATSCRQQK
ncbi:hypothetical protein EB796_011855 [Bugula neritina]|uniref:Uncharacterized protein n=1 Tax=Bugula neritina TaxID=10212 RepID=A0A7J7JV59_BUGNE|nr:hypothetical protein EB796_011855 [Bugula neritina]